MWGVNTQFYDASSVVVAHVGGQLVDSVVVVDQDQLVDSVVVLIRVSWWPDPVHLFSIHTRFLPPESHIYRL